MSHTLQDEDEGPEPRQPRLPSSCSPAHKLFKSMSLFILLHFKWPREMNSSTRFLTQPYDCGLQQALPVTPTSSLLSRGSPRAQPAQGRAWSLPNSHTGDTDSN